MAKPLRLGILDTFVLPRLSLTLIEFNETS